VGRLRLSLSLHAVVERAGVADGVRIALALVVVDGGQHQGWGQEAAVRVATAATHKVTRGRTRTRHDRGIMIGNEVTTGRWAKQEQEGPVVSRQQPNITNDILSYKTQY
jgi:hypothetical protein